MYHLPLLPGYGPHANVRSAAPPTSEDDAGGGGGGFSEAEVEEENGYNGTYFDTDTGITPPSNTGLEGYIPSSSANVLLTPERPDILPSRSTSTTVGTAKPKPKKEKEGPFAEAVFFAYGVVVFYGFTEEQERGILEDVEGAAVLADKLKETEWEIEQCHYAVRMRKVISQRMRGRLISFALRTARSEYSVSESIQRFLQCVPFPFPFLPSQSIPDHTICISSI